MNYRKKSRERNVLHITFLDALHVYITGVFHNRAIIFPKNKHLFP